MIRWVWGKGVPDSEYFSHDERVWYGLAKQWAPLTGRGSAWVLPLVLLLLLPLGCASTDEQGEMVWVQIVPGRRYTFRDVDGEVRGDTLVVKGQVIAIGHLESEFVSLIVEGRDMENKVQVRERGGARMQSRRERFSIRVPYQPDLDWTIRSYEGRGVFSKIRESL
jgi:hypothetical protein